MSKPPAGALGSSGEERRLAPWGGRATAKRAPRCEADPPSSQLVTRGSSAIHLLSPDAARVRPPARRPLARMPTRRDRGGVAGGTFGTGAPPAPVRPIVAGRDRTGSLPQPRAGARRVGACCHGAVPCAVAAWLAPWPGAGGSVARCCDVAGTRGRLQRGLVRASPHQHRTARRRLTAGKRYPAQALAFRRSPRLAPSSVDPRFASTCDARAARCGAVAE